MPSRDQPTPLGEFELLVLLATMSLGHDAYPLAVTRNIETRTKRFAPRRVVGGRYFRYAYRNFPVEVVWSGADTMANLNQLYLKAPFDFVVIHRRSAMRFDLRKDSRYEWLNAPEGQAAEYQIYRRVAP